MGLLRKSASAVLIFAVCIYFVRKYAQGPMCKSTRRLHGKVAIITGANTGIGKYTAQDILERGAKVYMACRSMDRRNEAARDILASTGADQDRLVVMKLDLSSLQSVREFATSFKTREKQLDILINNAAVALTGGKKTIDGIEETFAVNHLGHFLLTSLLLDLLKAAPKSRIVNVSAKAHEFAYMNFDDIMGENNYNGIFAYAQSKLANILFTKELAKKLKGTQVTTYSLHPGVIYTDLLRNANFLNFKPVRYIAEVVMWPFVKDTAHGAQTQICCAVSEEFEGETGNYYSDCQKKTPTKDAEDMEAAKKLWDLSENLIKSHSR